MRYLQTEEMRKSDEAVGDGGSIIEGLTFTKILTKSLVFKNMLYTFVQPAFTFFSRIAFRPFFQMSKKFPKLCNFSPSYTK